MALFRPKNPNRISPPVNPNIVVRAFLLVCLAILSAQSPRSVWDGIYTAEQATHGAAAYKEDCASCHGATLEGHGQNPALAGPDFLSNWNGKSLGDLFDKIQDSMPADRPGQLSRARNAEILAYLLQRNKFPAGSTPLAASGDALRPIRIEPDR